MNWEQEESANWDPTRRERSPLGPRLREGWKDFTNTGTNAIKWPWRLRAAMKYQARRQAKKNSPQVWWGRQFIRMAKLLTACWILIATADLVGSTMMGEQGWTHEKWLASMGLYLCAALVCWADKALRNKGFCMIAAGTAPSYSLTAGRHVVQDPTNLVIRTFDHSGRQFAFVIKED